MRGTSAGLLLGLLLAAGPALAGPAAAEIYRYVDSHGGVVLDRQSVPPEYAAKGYEVLDAQGRVIRVVPPAPTAEELHRRAEAQRQAEVDTQLRRRYPSVADLDVAMTSQLRDLDGFISAARSNQQALNDRLQTLETRAAEQQRGGQAVAPALLEQRESLRREQQGAEAELQRLQALRKTTEESFAAERARLVELLRH